MQKGKHGDVVNMTKELVKRPTNESIERLVR